MNCPQAKLLIDPYADGELEASAIMELERHIQGCPACALALRQAQSLKKALKQDALYFTAPAELRRRIKSELPSPTGTTRPRQAWNWNWLTTAMSGAFAVCLALLLIVTLAHPWSKPALARELVSNHIRSLMAAHALDVVSTDQHTVKPWFNGRLDFSPPVKDLATQGFPLIGGRLDYVGGRSVAALVFQSRNHIINLFVWPVGEADSKPAAFPPRQGYQIIHWSEVGMTFWSVSDLNEKELMDFANEYATAVSPKDR